MSEPTPEPTPPVTMTLAEIDQAIVDASREYIFVVRTYPRDAERIAAAKAAIEDLRDLRDALL